MKSRVVVGSGYLGLRVAERWQSGGDAVYAVTRSADKAARLAEKGFRPIVADVLVPESLKPIPRCQTILYSVGPSGQQAVSRFALYRDGLQNVLERWGSLADRVVFISSTGVYGDCCGSEFVDKQTPLRPQREASLALAEAEAILLTPPWRSKAVILRLGAIYGPGRLPLMKELQSGQPLPSDPDALLNLIYVDDAARAVITIADQATPPEIVNVVDGFPVKRSEFYRTLARLMNLPDPFFASVSSEKSPPSPSASRRGAKNRKISNQRLVERYGMTFDCPSYHIGLAKIVQNRECA